MFFLISKIGGTVLPNMTGTGIKCYKSQIALYPRPRVLQNSIKTANRLFFSFTSILCSSAKALHPVLLHGNWYT